jgi:DNA polymerase-1
MSSEKKLFLLDAMALIYRAYFAFSKNPRKNSQGLNTSAMFGFTNTLFEILSKQKPSHIAVAFDTKIPTMRHEDFVDYKANREDMPEDLAISIPYVREIISAFNIPVVFVDGYEADDVIGTLAKKAEKEGFTVYMMTPDKDFAQLVSDNIFMYKPAKNQKPAEIWGIPEVQKKFEVEDPLQVIDILGLWGDSADNIPGIPGIGEKRAKALIKEYKSLENIIENADKLKGKMAENVKNFAEQGIKSKKLATIYLDTPIEFNAKAYKYENPDLDKLKKLFKELEFQRLGTRILESFGVKSTGEGQTMDLFAQPMEDIKAESIESNSHDYKLVKSDKEISELIEKLKNLSEFCFDTETTSKSSIEAEIVGVSFSWKENEAYYLHLPENYNECIEILSRFKNVFENEKVLKIGQNLKYDISVLRWYEIDVKGAIFDTLIAHYLIEPELKHGMDFMAKTLLNYNPVSYDALVGKGKSAKKLRDIDLDKLKDYACEDADITFRLYQKLKPELEKNNAKDLFEKIEMPLVRVLSIMETEGVKLDTEALKDISGKLDEDVERIEKEIYEEAGHSFNISSPKQLGVVLFEELKITDKPKLTKTKQYSTSEDVLSKLEKKHPIVSKILEYRSLSKLKSTYVDALPKLISKRTNRLHTSYNQAVVATGRLSSNNPNLQNIPIRTKRGKEIRKAFVARNKNFLLLAADYSQIELRIIAHFSGDKNMIEDFNNDFDIHTATAARVFGIEMDKVDSDQRRNAKNVNFGLVYGVSAYGLSQNINVSIGEAKAIIDEYFNQYPGIKKYMDNQINFARENGYVETIMGRRRYLNDINSSNSVVRGFAERNAINAPIQGSSADMIKIAMINIQNEIENRKLKSKMLLQVHDELIFDMHRDEEKELKEIVESKMKSALDLNVKIVVDMKAAENWLQAH